MPSWCHAVFCRFYLSKRHLKHSARSALHLGEHGATWVFAGNGCKNVPFFHFKIELQLRNISVNIIGQILKNDLSEESRRFDSFLI